MPERIRTLILFVAGSLLFCWPAFLNKGPFLFPDTTTYIRAGDAAVAKLTGRTTRWSDRLSLTQSAVAQPSGVRTEAPVKHKVVPTKPVLNGRSVYYGLFLFSTLMVLGIYGPVLLVAALTCASLLIILHALVPPTKRSRQALLVCTIAGVGILTPLPFFVSRLMPDSFTGLLAVNLAGLFFVWPRLSKGARAWLLAVSAAAVCCHNSHILIAAGATAVGLILAWSKGRERRRVMLIGSGLIATAVLAQLLFASSVQRYLGAPPISPPFLSARLIDDGPGYRYLAENCPEAGWELCRFLDRLPQHSDTILWSEQPHNGVFKATSVDSMRRLGEQDLRFALAVLAAQPAATIGSSLRAIGRQASLFELEFFNLSQPDLMTILQAVPPSERYWISHTLGARSALPLRPFVVSAAVTALFSLLAIGAVLMMGRKRRSALSEEQRLALLLVATFLINIIICGALSTPHGRYQMRMIWILPVAALAAAHASKRRDTKASAT